MAALRKKWQIGFFIFTFVLLVLLPKPVQAGSCSDNYSCAGCIEKSWVDNCIWSKCTNSCVDIEEYSAGSCNSSAQLLEQCFDTDTWGGIPNGDSCANNYNCESGYCNNGVCCLSGTCCNNQKSCPLSMQCDLDNYNCFEKPAPSPTPTSLAKSKNGSTCRSNAECVSGNCRNGICCLGNKECCSDSNQCSADAYCSLESERYYCLPKLENGQACTDYSQCKSKNCGKGICCAGQPCCKTQADCGKDEYCEKKDNAYYCRIKWNEGEYCEDPVACRSGYCDTYTRKCAQSSGKVTPTPKKAVCGDNLCDDWLGENCCNCPGDCSKIADFCCSQESKYTLPRYRQYKIFQLYEPGGGAIPNGRLVVPKGISEKVFFESYQPKICSHGQIIDGECLENDQCATGVCVDNRCVLAVSSNLKAVEDKKVVEAIENEQTEYAKERLWVDAYDKIKGKTLSSTIIQGALEIKLDVQGSTAGEVPEVNVGDEVETRLEITNTSDYMVAVTAGIVYLGKERGSFKLEEKKYEITYGPLNQPKILGWFGTYLHERMGGKYFILPKGYQVLILSNVVPQQEGYLDVSGKVEYLTQMDPINSSLVGQAVSIPKDQEREFKIKEVSNSILVTLKKCNWWPFCL